MLRPSPKIIIISGPTASGKTLLSLELAKYIVQKKMVQYPVAIINFDSLLFYQELNIGTAKPTSEEILSVPHYFISSETIKNPINAATFVNKALPIIEDLHQKNYCIFLVGGSGFYLRALLQGMYDSPTDEKAKIRSDLLYQTAGIHPFLEVLKQHDPLTYAKLHPNDHYRIRRAVEHFWSTDIPFAQAKLDLAQKQQKSSSPVNHWNTLHIYLDIPKDEHWNIIAKRTDKMLAQNAQKNLQRELEEILEQGYTGQERPLQAIGYKEMLAYLRGEITSSAECRQRIIFSTRQLAKAQRTWFNKVQNKIPFNPLRDQSRINQLFEEFLKDEKGLCLDGGKCL